MRGELLVWGSTLFVARYERQELQLQRVGVDAGSKAVSLHPCSVALDAVSGLLPTNAQLVAAREVEDEELAIRYPLLVLQSKEAKVPAPATRKPIALHRRRRSLKSSSDSEATVLASTAGNTRYRLLFFVLCKAENAQDDNDTIHARFLNLLDVPVDSKSSPAPPAAAVDTPELQAFVTDGPHIFLFDRCSQTAKVLKRGRVESSASNSRGGFHVWREQLRVTGDDSNTQTCTSAEVVSCAYVSEALSTGPHLLIHSRISPPSLSESSEEHYVWSVLPVDEECVDRPVDKATGTCRYLPTFSLLGEGYDHKPGPSAEQVTCCCFISEESEWDFSDVSEEGSEGVMTWIQQTPPRPKCADLVASTLLVVGTSSNSVYVYSNGVLLASFVLPVVPTELCCISEDSTDQRYVVAVQSEDVARSFFVLAFSSSIEHASMELLLSFNHVGHALFGEFCCIQTASTSTPMQVLLLNDVPSSAGSGDDIPMEEAEKVNEHDADAQLVKRSVLITQKLVADEIKLSCHRLRLREHKNKNKNKNKKRARQGGKSRANADQAKGAFQYIERTQKASLHGRHQGHSDDSNGDQENKSTSASHVQLGKLADSLASRLDSGLRELERMRLVVNDKRELTQKLNQLVVHQWWQAGGGSANSEKVRPDFVSLVPRHQDDSGFHEKRPLIEMETVVSTALTALGEGLSVVDDKIDIDIDSANQDSYPEPAYITVESQVSLKTFRVTEYVPSSSLIRVEVVLRNESNRTLQDVFVSLTSPRGGHSATQGWTCSSSVVEAFLPSKGKLSSVKVPGEAHFQLELQFTPTFMILRTRKPLDAMLWLHEGSSVNTSMAATLPTGWCPGVMACRITPVSFTLDDLLGETTLSVCHSERGMADTNPFTRRECDQLLFVSAGTNLVSWMRGDHQATSSGGRRSPLLEPTVLRPTFTLADLMVGKRELALYESSRLLTSLPPDVYTMRYPFGRLHLQILQTVLRNMRLEILSIQRPGIDFTSLGTESDGPSIATTSVNGREEHQDNQAGATPEAARLTSLSSQREKQRATDLQVLRLLQILQKRANFHTMWFGSAPAVSG